jgi:hypothetical protein
MIKIRSNESSLLQRPTAIEQATTEKEINLTNEQKTQRKFRKKTLRASQEICPGRTVRRAIVAARGLAVVR